VQVVIIDFGASESTSKSINHNRGTTEVQPIKMIIALARVSCAHTFFNVALPK
jgi:hypothetical protein